MVGNKKLLCTAYLKKLLCTANVYLISLGIYFDQNGLSHLTDFFLFKAFYEDHSTRNKSLVKNATTLGGESKVPTVMHQIPASFCIDPDNENILTCPRVSLEKGAGTFQPCDFQS